MTDFNNPEERKQWEDHMDFLGRDDKEPMKNEDYEYLREKFGNYSIDELATKTYVYGMFDDVIVYLLPEKHGVLLNTVVNSHYLYKGQTELDQMFVRARNLKERYNSINRALM
jgi:hypothetical protein